MSDGHLVMNARMYSVTPAVEAAWRTLLEHVAREAGVPMQYMNYPAPQPLEDLWARRDLGCALMCGFPIASKLAPVIPIAAPIPRAAWACGRALYRTDLIVRSDSPYRTLEDTFGGRAGWTVEHSHSGFNAFRHHLLEFRTRQRPRLYSQMTGHLITARAVLDGVRDGHIDVGPLDAYWHLLIASHSPQLTQAIRVLASTALAPIPSFVCSAHAAGGAAGVAEHLARLKDTFASAASRPWFGALSDVLLLDGFVAVDESRFASTLEWDRAAKAAGYPLPA